MRLWMKDTRFIPLVPPARLEASPVAAEAQSASGPPTVNVGGVINTIPLKTNSMIKFEPNRSAYSLTSALTVSSPPPPLTT